MQILKYVFQQHGDERGQLVALEEFKDIPFEIKPHRAGDIGMCYLLAIL